MPDDLLFTATIIFALISGTIAGFLSLLTWEILRESPFGRAVLALALAMVTFILYHVILLLFPSTPMTAKLLKSAMFTGVMIFIWMMAWDQHRVQRETTQGNTRNG